MTDIVSFAWNGVDEPLRYIDFDVAPEFTILLFNYSGNAEVPKLPQGKSYVHYLSIKTEFKGSMLVELSKWAKPHAYRYIGIMDDDQQISCSGINTVLGMAHQHQFDAFHPSVSQGSFLSHARFLQQKNQDWEHVDWIEIMSPFLRKEVFESGAPFYKLSISSYGIDCFVFPFLLRKLNFSKPALVHAVSVKHLKPVTDGSRKFSNGLDARQEGELVRTAILKAIHQEKIAFSPSEMTAIYECNRIRWRKLKYDFKRFFGHLMQTTE